MIDPPGPNGSVQDSARERVGRRLTDARKELLETSTRSRLLHTPLGSPRAKIVEIHDEVAEEVFRTLVREGKAMTFLAAPDAEPEDGGEIALPQPDEEDVGEDGVPRRHTDTRLQTALPSARLQTRLRAIAYDAQTFENEQGVNILYLALGFLKWHELHDSEKPRYAPLVLVPVTLTRASASERFKVAYSGEELGTNLSLQQRLRDERIELPDLPDPDDLSPRSYTADVERAVAGIRQWQVLHDAIVLGFFSFAKLMMHRDLEPDRWPPDSGLREHPLIQAVLADGFVGRTEPLLPDDTPVDESIDIALGGHVVDADSSQMLAIEDARRGRNLVIQGPPGTGKSQTITNLIAAAVRDGKRVLFVAEKMAALNVVRANLGRAGLGQVCLELHSHKAKKKAVLDDLERTHQSGRDLWLDEELGGNGHAGDAGIVERLRTARDALNAHARRIHTPLVPSTRTPFQVFGTLAHLAGTGFEPPDFQLAAARGWTRSDMDNHGALIERLAWHVRAMGTPIEHPWRGVALDAALPQDAERFAVHARLLHPKAVRVVASGEALAHRVGAPCVTLTDARRLGRLGRILGRAPALDPAAMASAAWTDRRAEIHELVAQGRAYAAARARLAGVFVPAAWETDVTAIERALLQHGRSWLRWLRADYRRAVARFRDLSQPAVPRRVASRIEALQVLGSGQRARRAIRELDPLGRTAYGSHWRGEASDWALLEAIEAWEAEVVGVNPPFFWRQRLVELGDLGAYAAELGAWSVEIEESGAAARTLLDELRFDPHDGFGSENWESVSLAALRDRLEGFAEAPERLHQWCLWRAWGREGRNQGLGEIIDRLADGRLAPERAANVFRYACHEALARQVFEQHPELRMFDGRAHERTLADFRRLDQERIALARREIAARHVEAMPRGDRAVGELGILTREWKKQRRHLPLRQLVKQAGRAMQQIKPVWMMSPLSLAQFIEPGAIEFDLVLMDEASQVRPVEALGAVARAHQIVVVGDDKQLPPTSFFDRVASDDREPNDADEFQVADVQSILGLCVAQGIPARMLRWHYRSQHESLIAVSNLEFYQNLFIVPSAHADDLGLRFRKVNGVYDRGRTATNRVEAQAVARAVIEHARRFGRSARFPDGMSLGVGTFSVAQRNAILDELEILWRQHPEVAAFFEPNAPEPFFVKNLETIQGDERDVVFISVGYGPDENGFVAMSFGPLAAQGGERRLNVLISRARRRCEAFSSITAADIDLGRAQGAGVRVLKTFLQYAETGRLDRATPGTRAVDSDFEADVADALARIGYDVRHQVGVAGFFVDLAIQDQERAGRYLLGIECDGATYHSCRSVRDRDRLREEVLRSRGWQIHRIWSTDWYRRRSEELKRTVAAIEVARSVAPAGGAAPTAPVDGDPPPRPGAPKPGRVGLTRNPPAAGRARAYVEASLSRRIDVEPHELPLSQRVAILVQIIATEGPIHREEVGRRYAAVCGRERAGSRIQKATKEGLAKAVRDGTLHADGPFYARTPLNEFPPRDRSSARSPTLRRPEMLPPVEIRTGLRQIVAEHVGVEPHAAIVEVARMLGFQRTGTDLQHAIDVQLQAMLGAGVLVLRNGDRLYLA